MIEGTVSLKCSRCNHCEVCKWVDLKMNGCDWFEEEPRTGWIPVSERLPEAWRYVNCTCHSLVDDREDWVIETCYVPQPKGSPYSDWGNIVMLNDGEYEVVAWMYREIPKPYKASPTGAEGSDKE